MGLDRQGLQAAVGFKLDPTTSVIEQVGRSPTQLYSHLLDVRIMPFTLSIMSFTLSKIDHVTE